MDDYISKPINKDELHKVLEQIATHRYSKAIHIIQKEENETDKIQNNIQNQLNESQESKTYETKETKIILASESPFLANYMKNTLKENFDVAANIQELSKLVKKENLNIILIEEEFGGANLEQLISSIKEENPDTIIIAISEKEIKNADAIIEDLNPEEIEKTIQKALK